MKVLYLCPDLPIGKNSGGAQAHKYFIKKFLDLKNVDVQVVGVSDKFIDYEATSNISVLPLKKRTIFDFLVQQIRQLSYPFKIVSRSDSSFVLFVRNLIESIKYDLVVIDHFDALSIVNLNFLEQSSIPVLYIAHNIESKLVYDISQLYPLYNPKHWLALFDSYRVKRLEKRLIKLSKKVVFISQDDLSDFYTLQGGVFFRHIPSMMPDHVRPLNLANKCKKLFFSMNYSYKPNFVAFKWIVEKLAPELLHVSPDIKVVMTGIPQSVISRYKHIANLELHGHLPRDEYDIVLNNVDAFICPIKYGSGLKMKIVESLHNGIPVFAFADSWRGLKEVSVGGIISEDPRDAANTIIQTLTNPIAIKSIRLNQANEFSNIISKQPSIPDILGLI